MKYESILVTGGTGSFGKAFILRILDKYPNVKRLIVYSRDELKQFEMMQKFPQSKYPAIRYFLGDVRDISRLKLALKNVDVVIHAAALKQVVAAEYNPFEVIKTNIIGAQNIVEAAIACGVKRVVALSTDKAAAPINLYGASKLCSDKLFASANNLRGTSDFRTAIVRYGNVIGSRGSVIPFFLERRSDGVLPVTHNEMTRFSISLEEGVDMVLWALENCEGGEIFVPKIPSYHILDVVEAVAPNCEVETIGIRPGEKIHEEMITLSDAHSTLDLGQYYAILPSLKSNSLSGYAERNGGTIVPSKFSYNSGANDTFLTVDQIRDLIRQHIDANFDI